MSIKPGRFITRLYQTCKEKGILRGLFQGAFCPIPWVKSGQSQRISRPNKKPLGINPLFETLSSPKFEKNFPFPPEVTSKKVGPTVRNSGYRRLQPLLLEMNQGIQLGS